MTASPLTRAEARERWGDPDDEEGSVNDPRTREEHGVRFNARWIYFLPCGERRVVYWHRYDWRGALRVGASGEVLPEPA